MPDLHASLGAGPPAGTLQITLFIPSVDRHDAPIAQEHWREQALRALGRLFRGATAFPPGRGVWRDDTTGDLVFDDTVMVTSYIADDALTEAALASLRGFLHRLGRETNQGEVGLIVENQYYGITEFDTDDGDNDG